MKKIFKNFLIIASFLLTLGVGFNIATNANTNSKTNETTPRAGISGKTTINGIKYNWSEASFGKNRGMLYNPGRHEYIFSPNPHNDPWYNKNQVKFYNQANDEITKQGNAGKWTANNWPSSLKITVHGVIYQLSIR